MPRRLPTIPQPLAEESFFSWVDHLAFCYEVDRIVMMHALGLGQRRMPTAARDLIRYTMRLRPEAIRVVRAATGLTVIELGQTTLERTDPRYVTVNDSRMPKETWAYCPPCLAPGGSWPLWWYQPWAVACPVHRCYLVSFCPHCGTAFTPERTSSRWGASRQCRGFRNAFARRHPPGAPRKHCNRHLWDISTAPVSDPVVLDAVERLRHGLSRRALPDVWLRTFHVLNALFNYHTFEVRSFDSPDPVLRRRFSPQRLPERSYSVDSTGFLEPVRTHVDGTPHPVPRTPSAIRSPRPADSASSARSSAPTT
ncbi:TniQ family protein [Streptomyces sp. NBC_00038]|uniref:TniQ family protein n=1 Tax=Streptomyces sp. NBC_00038 TaxID=2903615 RepID=UPI00224DA6E7|nr:TniQ family protein [Streptomyces sp. NBC_00038]MCX5559513.1 TniQ family protein [Streptomyces sp. NBC_00038]